MALWLRGIALAQMIVACVVVQIALAAGQVQTGSNDGPTPGENARGLTRIEREVDRLRNERLPERMAVMESVVFEGRVIWRSVAVAVAAQLMLQVIASYGSYRQTKGPRRER